MSDGQLGRYTQSWRDALAIKANGASALQPCHMGFDGGISHVSFVRALFGSGTFRLKGFQKLRT